jgi:hypothetical protein
MTEPTRSRHARASVDPTVNVYASDAPFFEATYRASGSIADKRAAASLEPARVNTTSTISSRDCWPTRSWTWSRTSIGQWTQLSA